MLVFWMLVFWVDPKINKKSFNSSYLTGPEEAMDTQLGWANIIHFGQSQVIIEGIVFREMGCQRHIVRHQFAPGRSDFQRGAIHATGQIVAINVCEKFIINLLMIMCFFK